MCAGKLFDQLQFFIGFGGVVDRRECVIFFRASRNHNVLAKLCLAGGREEPPEERQAPKSPGGAPTYPPFKLSKWDVLCFSYLSAGGAIAPKISRRSWLAMAASDRA